MSAIGRVSQSISVVAARRALYVGLLITSSACSTSDSLVSYEPGNAASATGLVISFIDLLNTGRYDEALRLFAFDLLEREGVSREYFVEYVDERVTRGRTVTRVEPIAEEFVPEQNTTRVIVKIRYREGDDVTRTLQVLRIGQGWELTSRGTLL